MAGSQSASTGTPVYSPEDNLVTEMWVLCTIFPSLATIAVALRFWARRLKELPLWWDDWTALLALILAWGVYACAVMAIPYGAGRHIVFVDKKGQEFYKLAEYCLQVIYCALPPTVKISALFLYKRIFISRKFNMVTTGLILLLAAWAVVAVFISIFGCIPPDAFWKGGGQCISFHVWVFAYGVPNIVLDVVTWFLPIPKVWMLKLPKTQKTILTLIFLIGLTDCALAIIRLVDAGSMLGDPDFTYTWAYSKWWCLIHTCVGIIVISLPTMRIFLTKLNRLFGGPPVAKVALASVSGHSHAKSHVPTRQRQDVEASLTGEHDSSLHSNSIALALRRDSNSTDTFTPETGIQVTSEFTLETQKVDEIKAEPHNVV